jgi:uncharacterized protein (TIGR02001 family)
MIGRYNLLFTALLLAGWPSCASAQEDAELSANAGLVSDYRFRGISLSNRNPAVQGGIDLEGENFFAGTWASTIAETGGADVEVDLYAGLQGSVGEVVWTAAANAYLYPGGDGQNYVEFIATGERSFGRVTLGIEAALAPRQANVDEANRYIGASSALDVGGGWTVSARGGFENGFYDSKWDWEIGAKHTVGALTASLAYVDTNYGGTDEAGRLARAGLVGSLVAEF